MNIEAFFDPRTFTLTYVVFDPSTRDAVIIDPVLDYEAVGSKITHASVTKVLDFVRGQRLQVHAILETHAHADHISGSQALKEALPGAELVIGAKITAVQELFKGFFDLPSDFPTDGRQFDRLLGDGEILEAGSLRVEAIATPGHTPACLSYRIQDAVFTGDALFMPDYGTGRCDFPAGDPRDLYTSITERLYTLPDGTTYILDLDNRKIRRLDPSSGTLRTVLTDPGGFGAGRGLWVSQDESRIYYNGALGAGSSQSVQTWTPEAGIQTFTSLPGDLGNLTVDPGGHLVVTSRAQHRVYRVSLDGTTFTTIAGNGTTARAVSGQPALATGMERVRGIAFRPDGSYFLCSQKGGDVLFVDTAGIAHVYLTGAANGNNRNGDGSPPDAPGGPKISEPRAVSLAPDGTLLITTNDNGFVRAVPSLCPPAPPTSLTLTRSQDTLTLSFPPAGDTPYILETSPDLNGDWSPLGFTVDGTADLPADGRGGYFRVRAPRWQP